MDILNNKYYNWYYNLINSRSKLKRSKKDAYYESHHIIPKSCNGSNDKTNLVLLTAKEHFIAHLLLPKFTKGLDHEKMVRARWYMCNLSKYKNKINSRLFEKYRLEHSNSMKGSNNHWFGTKGPMNGRKHSKESKAKMSKSAFSKPKVSEQTKRLLSEKLKGKIRSKEHSKNISLAKLGSSLSQKHKDNISNSILNKNNPSWKGYWITPIGKFETLKSIDVSNGLLSIRQIRDFCKNNRVITKTFYQKSNYLNKTYDNSIIGKSLRDLGFTFEKSHE